MLKSKLPASSPDEVFLATIHDATGHAHANSGMLIASSTDGVNFHNISDSNESLYTPVNGVRAPSVLYWQGQWYMVYSYGPSIEPLIFLLKSSDLLNWEPIGSLRLAENLTGPTDNFINIPQWIVDPKGNVHIIASLNSNAHYVEIHPLNADPATWGDQDNWLAVTTMTSHNGEPLPQGNTFIALRNGTYYMAFNGRQAISYHMRTSSDLTSGWSESRPLVDLDSSVNYGDSQNLVFLSDGTLRFYISNGNSITYEIWYMDSMDLGITWTLPKLVKFSGFEPKKINWAHFVRITDPAALSTLQTKK